MTRLNTLQPPAGRPEPGTATTAQVVAAIGRVEGRVGRWGLGFCMLAAVLDGLQLLQPPRVGTEPGGHVGFGIAAAAIGLPIGLALLVAGRALERGWRYRWWTQLLPWCIVWGVGRLLR